MFDYIKLGPNRAGLYGAIMMVDRFARLTWFVAARTTTPAFGANPSISTSSALSVCAWTCGRNG